MTIQMKVILAALVLLLGTTVLPAAPQKPAAKPAAPKHDPVVEAQLRASFGRVDLNRDGSLDEDELARAFRGVNAKPPARPETKYDEKGNPISSGEVDLKKYPDQVYLLALDKNGDNRISWAEFEEYGEAYYAQIANAQKQNQQAMQAAYTQARAAQFRRGNNNYSRYGSSRYGSRYGQNTVRSHAHYRGASNHSRR